MSPCATSSAKTLPSWASAFGGSSSVRSSTSRVAFSGMDHREAETLARFEIRLRHRARERAHAADVSGALGHRDGAARVEQVEGVRALEDHLVRRQYGLRFHEALRLVFKTGKKIEIQLCI